MPVTLVKGKEVKVHLEAFAPGILQKDLVTFPASEKMCTGYFKVLPGTPDFHMDMPFEEINYIIEGGATISDETGVTYTAEKGDIICLRKGSKVTIRYRSDVGFEGIYVTYPYGWKELSKK